MRAPAFCTAILAYVVIGHPPPAVAQVDEQRAQEYFKEAQALCERDGGRLWGVSICAPMVIGDARTQTFATSQPPPDAPRPQLIGLLNGPIKWGDTMWAALTWDTIANWPARTRGEACGRRPARTRYPDKVESERALYILEGFASYTQTVLTAPSEADAIARAIELLADAENGESFVRTFTYTSGPAKPSRI